MRAPAVLALAAAVACLGTAIDQTATAGRHASAGSSASSADITAKTGPAVSPAWAEKAAGQHIDLTRWTTPGDDQGTYRGARSTTRGIVVGRAAPTVGYDDPYGGGGTRRYDRGRWYSPWIQPGFSYEELIASYNARTPVGTFIEIEVRGRTFGGRTSSWDSLGRWASHDEKFHRMSLGTQPDDLGRVAVDTWRTEGTGLARWQLRLSLLRRAASDTTPVVSMVAAMTSRLPATAATSRPSGRRTVDLSVPRHSQQVHLGHYPQWNGGGQAWCSPTSTAMVVRHWGRGPTPAQYSWVSHRRNQPWVDYTARGTYASGYDGTGDWPFNTAYAARWGLDAFVTRLRSIREAEMFVRAGIPLVASIDFDAGELDGSPINDTNGHVVVIRGVTARGKVIVNDPAAPGAASVRRVYKRGQFENAWIDATGGVVYVIHPAGKPLPNPARHSNW